MYVHAVSLLSQTPTGYEPPTGKGRPKYEQLRAKLGGQLTAGQLEPGDMLPPEPVMAEQMSVARSTVRQALAQMERSGLIRRIRGKGTFIHEDAHNRLRTRFDAFALIVPDTQRGYYPSLLAGFEQAAAAVHNQMIVVSTRNDVHRQADGILQLIDKQVAGVAIVPATSPPTPGYQIRQLQKQQIPVVLCHRGVDGVRAPVLAFNGREVGRLAGEAMTRLGHRRVAFISTVRSPLAEAYEAGLRAAVEAAGGSLTDHRLVYVGDDVYGVADYEQRMDAAIGGLMGLDDRPTALFATFDDVAELIFLQLMRRGVSVPRDVSLVSFGGASRLGAMQQRLTAVTVDEAELGRLAVDVLCQMCQGRKPIESDDRIEIPLDVSEGQSLGVAPGN
jgi:DNA-binding LacI/PurR family transcriptional regulator